MTKFLIKFENFSPQRKHFEFNRTQVKKSFDIKSGSIGIINITQSFGHGSAVSLQLIMVGRRQFCVPKINRGRETALPCPKLVIRSVTRIDMTREL